VLSRVSCCLVVDRVLLALASLARSLSVHAAAATDAAGVKFQPTVDRSSRMYPGRQLARTTHARPDCHVGDRLAVIYAAVLRAFLALLVRGCVRWCTLQLRVVVAVSAQ